MRHTAVYDGSPVGIHGSEGARDLSGQGGGVIFPRFESGNNVKEGVWGIQSDTFTPAAGGGILRMAVRSIPSISGSPLENAVHAGF
jgi:hypothetical protein